MASLVTVSVFVLLFLFTSGTADEDPRRNDKIVESLRGDFNAVGLAEPPAPPADLGVHTACVKFGFACPDSYVGFLRAELSKLRGPADEASYLQAEEPDRVAKDQPAPRRVAEGNDPVEDVKLERMQRLRNVYRDKLLDLHTSGKGWECFLTKISCVIHSVFLSRTAVFVSWFWSYFVPTVPATMIILVVLTWVFFGTHIPKEHACCLRATRPAFAMDLLMARKGPPRSVASLVIERERCSFEEQFAAVGGLTGDATPGGEVQEPECNRRDEYWDLVRFSLLEAYDMYHMEVVVLKLRLVLSLLVLLALIWSVVSLPLQAVDLQSGGFVRTLMASLLPTWVPAMVGLHFAWSCVGGLVAFACWEAFAAGEMLCRLNARSAAMCDSILKQWSWKFDQ